LSIPRIKELWRITDIFYLEKKKVLIVVAQKDFKQAGKVYSGMLKLTCQEEDI
jgi:hypothetical protein